jgi:GT2 family glycosyltransferase
MRRSVYDRTTGFDESMGHVYEDADLFLRMALLAPVHYLPEPLVRYRRHANQSTRCADHVFAQEKKLRAKWRNLTALTSDQRKVVEAAWRFYEGRLVPADGFSAAMNHLRRLELIPAARFIGGALKRYARSVLSQDHFPEPSV